MPNKPRPPEAVFAAASYAPPKGVPWINNWDDDLQPFQGTIQDYNHAARKNRIAFLKQVKQLMAWIPGMVLKDDRGDGEFELYTRDDMPTLIAELEASDLEHDSFLLTLDNLKRLDNYSDKYSPDGGKTFYTRADLPVLRAKLEASNRFLKAEDSANRKLERDENINMNPARLNDYLRCQLLIERPAQAALARTLCLGGLNPSGITLTAHKDNFRRPCTEGGHHALKMHWLIKGENGENSILAEVQIGIKQMEFAEKPKLIRKLERNLLTNAENLERNFGDSDHMNSFAAILRNDLVPILQPFRRHMNYAIASDLGFHVMYDPDINPATEIDSALYTYAHGMEEIQSHGTKKQRAAIEGFRIPDIERYKPGEVRYIN